jgi:hypothetical protein
VQPFFGDDAYEIVTVAGYMRELFMVRKTDNLGSLPGFRHLYPVMSFLTRDNRTIRFEEVGSTLFSTIDKIRKCERLLGPLGFETIAFKGVEVFDLLIDAATALHPGEDLQHFRRFQDIPENPAMAVGYSYGSTSYAFGSTEEFVTWLARLRFSVHGGWFSTTGMEHRTNVLSNQATLFDFDRLVTILHARGYRVHHLSSQSYKLTNENYILTWFMTENFAESDRPALAEHVKRFDQFLTEKVDLMQPLVPGVSRGACPYAGPHSNAIFSEHPAGPEARHPSTFDFSSPDMERRFKAHLEGSRAKI